MPTTETSPKFIPEPRYVMYRTNALKGWMVVDCAGAYRGCPSRAGDLFKTHAAAEYACRLLNQGNARINPHAVVGCRVEAR